MTRPGVRGAAAKPPASLLRLNRHSLAPILVVGGRGVGREAVARAFHQESPLRGMPFLALDCRYDTATLERALECWMMPTSRPGVFNPLSGVAGGMLFLDQLECLPSATQQQLLLVSRRMGAEGDGDGLCLPRRLAAGSRWYVPSTYGRRLLPELLDAVDKIRVEVESGVPD